MYQRILVPVDSSPPSNRGLEEAIRVAKLTGGRLRLIHVIDELSMELYTSARAGGWLDALRASGERILERAKADALGNGVEVDTVLHSDFSGPIDQKVASEARRWPADLIVLGTHGRRGIRRWMLCSDAQCILRTSTAPVLLVRAQEIDSSAERDPNREFAGRSPAAAFES